MSTKIVVKVAHCSKPNIHIQIQFPTNGKKAFLLAKLAVLLLQQHEDFSLGIGMTVFSESKIFPQNIMEFILLATIQIVATLGSSFSWSFVLFLRNGRKNSGSFLRKQM